MDPSDRPEPPDPVPPGNAGDEPPDEKGLVEEMREGVEHVVEEVREGVEHVVEEVREGVEHVVEEVREEVEELHERIEEAVEEHLPRRARYRAGRIAWLILGSFVGLIALGIGGGLVYLGRHSEQVAGELTRVLNQALAQHSDLVLEVRDLEGNPFQQVRLIRPRLDVGF